MEGPNDAGAEGLGELNVGVELRNPVLEVGFHLPGRFCSSIDAAL